MSSIIRYEQKQMERLTLWYYLTFDCNMFCYYCYDIQLKRRKILEMNKKVVKSIQKWISRKKTNYEQIDIILFGGEPLLKIELIQYLYRIMNKKFKNRINLSMITNGYALTYDNILLLKKMNVNSYQITIDGFQKTHDSRRKAVNGDGTYRTIMNNIQNLLQLNLEAQITIRINIDNDNKNSIMEFLTKELCTLKNRRIIVSFARVKETAKGELEDNIIHEEEYLEIYDQLSKYCFNNGIDVTLSEFTSCTRQNSSKFCFDCEGNIYKCNNSVGDTKYIVGNTMKKPNDIKHDFIFENNLDEHCKECYFIRYCMGGCIYQLFKEKNDIHSGMKNCNKKYFEKLIKIHYINKYNCDN